MPNYNLFITEYLNKTAYYPGVDFSYLYVDVDKYIIENDFNNGNNQIQYNISDSDWIDELFTK